MAESPKPKDAAAIVLTRGNKICWAERSAQLNFLSGYRAFPGGRLEASDYQVSVANGDDEEQSALITCAARECFEEVGVLLARGGEKLTKGQRLSIHDDLISGRMTFAEILKHWGLWLDAKDFTFVGTWTTPPFSPVRFKTRFFLIECPAKQQPFAASGELKNVEFTDPQIALQKWQNGEILCAPPILNTFRILNAGLTAQTIAKLLALAEMEGENTRKIEFNPLITCFPLRTETLLPATHTNCFIVGTKNFIVIDPASPFEDEQNALANYISELIKNDKTCRAIYITHEHHDHIGGTNVLREYLRQKFELEVPIIAHSLTAERLPSDIKVHETVMDNQEIEFVFDEQKSFRLKVLHTPGHARGHLCFYCEELGSLLSSDNVVGTGTVAITPPDGKMRDYLYSLKRMRSLSNLRFLCGSHGAAVADAKGKIDDYIAHRQMRERQILEAWQSGARTPDQIVEKVYTDLQPELRGLAEKSVLAHLEKLNDENLIQMMNN